MIAHKSSQVRRLGRQGRARLADLYEAHGPHALRLAYVLTGDRELAQDLVQDAFVKVSGRFADLRDPEAFQAYLMKTIVNLARMHWRRKRIERAAVERERPAHSRDTNLPDLEGYEEIKAALMGIHPRQRAAIVLRFFEDLSEAQTAAVLGCATGTVKSLVHRGLQTMRTEMEQ
ncbi:MAG: SigE family RNA polymerase sigma factor [Actinomycetota bacterium]|nr:SigE family RNA polymerase sigma factor [Actinomycetota bacterium]